MIKFYFNDQNFCESEDATTHMTPLKMKNVTPSISINVSIDLFKDLFVTMK